MAQNRPTRPAPTNRQFAATLIGCLALALVIGFAVAALQWPLAVGAAIGLSMVAALVGWALWHYR